MSGSPRAPTGTRKKLPRALSARRATSPFHPGSSVGGYRRSGECFTRKKGVLVLSELAKKTDLTTRDLLGLFWTIEIRIYICIPVEDIDPTLDAAREQEQCPESGSHPRDSRTLRRRHPARFEGPPRGCPSITRRQNACFPPSRAPRRVPSFVVLCAWCGRPSSD